MFEIELIHNSNYSVCSTQVHNLENLPIVDSMDVLLENVFVKAHNTYANKVCFFHCSLFVCSTCLSVWFALAMMIGPCNPNGNLINSFSLPLRPRKSNNTIQNKTTLIQTIFKLTKSSITLRSSN